MILNSTPTPTTLQSTNVISITANNGSSEYVLFSSVIDPTNTGIYVFSFWIKNAQDMTVFDICDGTLNTLVKVFINQQPGDDREFIFSLGNTDIITQVFTLPSNTWRYFTGFVNVNAGSERGIVTIDNTIVVDIDSFTGTSTLDDIENIKALATSDPIGAMVALQQVWVVPDSGLDPIILLDGLKTRIGNYYNNRGGSFVLNASLLQLNTFGKDQDFLFNGVTQEQATIVGADFEVFKTEDIRL